MVGEHHLETNAQMGWIAHKLVGEVSSVPGYWIAGLLGFAAIGRIARLLVAVTGRCCRSLQKHQCQ